MDAGGPQVRVVCVTTGAGDGDDEVANHWNARGTQAAFRTAGTALAAAGARTARPLRRICAAHHTSSPSSLKSRVTGCG